MATDTIDSLLPLSVRGRQVLSDRKARAYRGEATRLFHARCGDESSARHILVIGDSNTEGYGASIWQNRWIMEFQRSLRSQFHGGLGPESLTGYWPSCTGGIIGAGGNGVGDHWQNTGGTNQGQEELAGTGLGVNASGIGLRTTKLVGTASRTFTGIGTDFELFYQQRPSHGTIQITLDGVVLGTTCATANATQKGARIFTTGLTGLELGLHTIKLQATTTGSGTADTIYIEGIHNYIGGIDSGIHVWDGGHSNFWTDLYNTSSTMAYDQFDTTAGGGKEFIHVVIALGTNDISQRTAAQYGADLQAMMTNCETKGYEGGFTVLYPHPSVSYATNAPYQEAAWTAVNSRSNADLIELPPIMGQGPDFDEAPYLLGTSTHYNDRGHKWLGRIVAEALVPKAGYRSSETRLPLLDLYPASGVAAITLDLQEAATVVLNQNVTSTTISTAAFLGQRLTITYKQDSTGGRSYVWPTSVKWNGGVALSNITTPDAVQSASFRWDGTSWVEESRAGSQTAPAAPTFAVNAVATTSITLSGTQTVDGVSLTAGMVVLTTAQSGNNSGPWVVQSGTFTRPTWWATGSNQAAGSGFYVVAGTAFPFTTFRMNNSVTVDSGAPTIQQATIRSAVHPTFNLTDAATVTVDSTPGSEFLNLTLGGNRTMGAPSPSSNSNGTMLRFRIKQPASGGPWTLAWASNYRFPGGVAPTLSTAASATDYVEFRFNTTDIKWDLVSFVPGTHVLPEMAAVVALTDGATIATDVALGETFSVTLGGNRAMGAPTNARDGKLIVYRLRQDATGSRTITWNAVFRFGTDVASPTLTTTAAKTDYVSFRYNATDSKWDCVDAVRGY